MIEMLSRAGAKVEYNDPYFPEVGQGRKYRLHMRSVELGEEMEALERFDCVLIATDHTAYDFAKVVERSRLVVDTRNATRGVVSKKIVRC
jgi:UDP-N-acetyl-D-glucosamine dehydrogenase